MTLGEFCFTIIRRADIEGSKSNVAMNAWLPQKPVMPVGDGAWSLWAGKVGL